MGDEGKKRSKKGVFAFLFAIAGAMFFFMKKRKRGGEESSWEEATPGGSV